MEIKKEPCRIKDEDTEEQIGWCFSSFSDENSLITITSKSRY